MVPGFEKHYNDILKEGVDDVYCLSVNDAFVMRQWGLKEGYVSGSWFCWIVDCLQYVGKRHLTTSIHFDLFFISLDEDKTPGSLGFKKVKLIPDGAAEFTRGMGFSCVWDSERGFGERSWRYSMLVNDMKIEKIFTEKPLTQNDPEDPFEHTSAETMLAYLKTAK